MLCVFWAQFEEYLREKIEGENEEAREEKNKERPTTETPSYRRSLHKSLSPREEKSQITINPTFP